MNSQFQNIAKQKLKKLGWYSAIDRSKNTFFFKLLDLTDFKIALHEGKEGYINLETWEIIVEKGPIDDSSVCTLTNFIHLDDLMENDVEAEMLYRKNFLEKVIQVEGIKYKILNMYHHIHAWTVFNIENVETREAKQIFLTDYDNWSWEYKSEKLEIQLIKE